MTPVWLKTFYEKWRAARGNLLLPSKLPFRYDWQKLLDEAGLRLVEDRNAAERDLKVLCHAKGSSTAKLEIKTHKYRHYLIEKVILPLESEVWLMETFGHIPAAQLHQDTLQIVEDFRRLSHAVHPALWENWCNALATTFKSGKNLAPLFWGKPHETRNLMMLVYRFTSVVWQEGTRVREASEKLDLGSKGLEDLQPKLESCLSSFFGRPVTLESSGLILTESKVELAGNLTLHYADGSTRSIHKMKGVTSVSLLPDLEDAVKATTSATRLLTVENSKTTLPCLAAKNDDGQTLLAACSFPTRALVRLLHILPPDLPIHHFGDTDPFGYLILSKLRQKINRTVHPFLMKNRSSKKSIPLTERDLAILPGLLSNPYLTDVRPDLEQLMETQNKGGFEQESLGKPTLNSWPFYNIEGV